MNLRPTAAAVAEAHSPARHAARVPPVTVGRVRGHLLDLERWTLLRLRERAERLRKVKTARHLRTGERGELEAMFFLRRRGYRFAEKRWRTAELKGDLDLVGWDGDTLVLVEVKSRTARDLAPAESSVDEPKQRMLRRMARAYRRTLPRATREQITLRFDLVSVYLVQGTIECELIRGAFPVVEPEREWTPRRF